MAQLKLVRLKQKHLVAFDDEMAELPEDTRGLASMYAYRVKSAITAGWFANGKEPVDPDEVDDMEPAQVTRLDDLIVKTYNDAVTIPPN